MWQAENKIKIKLSKSYNLKNETIIDKHFSNVIEFEVQDITRKKNSWKILATHN